MGKIDLIDNGWVDLVFDGKNQAYGAYQLRLMVRTRPTELINYVRTQVNVT